MSGAFVTRLALLVFAVAAVWMPVAFAADPTPLAVRFHSADPARTLIGGHYLKPSKVGPQPAVVMLHGCAGMLTASRSLRPRPAFWARWLWEKGYAVLLADSFTPRGHGGICTMAERPLHPDRERPYDAYGALRFLQAQPEVDPARVAVMGWSNGAMTLLWAVKTDARQRPVDLDHPFRAAVAFYPGCSALKRQAYATEVPTLLQLGADDDWTPARHCLVLTDRAAAGVPIRADVYAEAHHGFDHPASVVRQVLTRAAGQERRVHVGTNLKARNSAVVNVEAFLARHLRP